MKETIASLPFGELHRPYKFLGDFASIFGRPTLLEVATILSIWENLRGVVSVSIFEHKIADNRRWQSPKDRICF